MDFVVHYVLHRCAVCRSHAECPVRVGWRLGPIVLCGYFHVNEQGDVEAIHIASMYMPGQQVNAEADGNVKHAFTQTDDIVVMPLMPAEQQQAADDEVNADSAPDIWTPF